MLDILFKYLSLFLFIKQDDDVDPNEIYPWFHGTISKEAAVEKLAKSRSSFSLFEFLKF